jgi:hypothetical protein
MVAAPNVGPDPERVRQFVPEVPLAAPHDLSELLAPVGERVDGARHLRVGLVQRLEAGEQAPEDLSIYS